MEIAYRADASSCVAAEIDRIAEWRRTIESLAAGNEEHVPALIDAILEGAAELEASDVHIESRADGAAIRLRVDGELLDLARLSKARSENVFARLKLMARVVTYRKRAPQDGRLLPAEGSALRAAFMPTLHGEKAVLRLPNSLAPRELHDIGMGENDLQRLEAALLRSQGTILFTGPCSSGKSTSIYAALRYLLANSSLTPNIVTLEDPIEQEIDGVNQTQIDEVGGLTFISGLRTLLRMDPNVIVVGEVRDEETANTIIQAGLSGHLVISTIHGGSAAQVFARLLHMGIEPFLIASSLSAVVAQRLIRRLCVDCRQERSLSEIERRTLWGDSAIAPKEAFSAAGCPACNGTGYSGRVGVFEVAVTGEQLREAVLVRQPTGSLHEAAIAEGMTPLLQAAAEMAARGLTSMEEIARVIA